jgi:CRISPR-associated exonuclease Cas4
MFAEEDLLPISALQHLAFCERQWGLMYLEAIWDENRLTIEGHYLHERADISETESRGNVRIASGLRLRSLKLGLTGRADVVEFHRLPEKDATPANQSSRSQGLFLEGVLGLWRPVPVEYKHGRPKPDPCDEVQLCAQAFCLEEMLEVDIPSGAIFYGMPRRRYDVIFNQNLRKETETLVARLHELYQAGKTPLAKYEKKCKNCSLLFHCLPQAIDSRHSVQRYLCKAMTEVNEELEEK